NRSRRASTGGGGRAEAVVAPRAQNGPRNGREPRRDSGQRTERAHRRPGRQANWWGAAALGGEDRRGAGPSTERTADPPFRDASHNREAPRGVDRSDPALLSDRRLRRHQSDVVAPADE